MEIWVKILLCITVAALLSLIKTLGAMWIVPAYMHVGGYWSRIEDTYFCEYVMRIMSGERRDQDAWSELMGWRKALDTSLSLWNWKRNWKNMMDLHRREYFYSGLRLTNRLGCYDSQINGIDPMEREDDAGAVGRKLFETAAKAGSEVVHSEDLQSLNVLHGLDAVQIFMKMVYEVNDVNVIGNEISRVQIEKWVAEAFRERAAILSLKPKTVARKFHQVMNVAVVISTLIICLPILEFDSKKFLGIIGFDAAAAMLLAGSMWKRMMFIFAGHPYDVGDTVEIDGKRMVVQEVGLFSTAFKQQENGTNVVRCTSDLLQQDINNHHQSRYN